MLPRGVIILELRRRLSARSLYNDNLFNRRAWSNMCLGSQLHRNLLSKSKNLASRLYTKDANKEILAAPTKLVNKPSDQNIAEIPENKEEISTDEQESGTQHLKITTPTSLNVENKLSTPPTEILEEQINLSQSSEKVKTPKVGKKMITPPSVKVNEKLMTSPSTKVEEKVMTPPPLKVEEKHISPPKLQTKTFDVATTKGVLSVTTTIEDSKINELVFEKSETIPNISKQKPIASASASIEDVPKQSIANKIAKMAAQALIPAKAAEPKAVTATEQKKTEVADVSVTSATTLIAEATPPPKPKKPTRMKVDYNRSSLERNFITPSRAMSDFLLKASDLESLAKIKRRSPYEQEPPMEVFWRNDVQAKAIEVWGSLDLLTKELIKRDIDRKTHQQNLFTVKRRLRDYRREIGQRAIVYDEERGLQGKSGKVVLIAIGINSVNFLFKVCGWLYTGSHSMFAEAIHSLADTINQLILAYGIHKSTQIPDFDHPYGYANMKHVSSLISGVGIFCVGAGLSIYHGITGIINPIPVEDFYWAFFILGGSLVSEGATMLVAVNEIRRAAKLKGITFTNYVWSGKDPCVNVVLTEDAAAVTSVAVAASCMGLSTMTGSSIFDACGSLFIGGILGGVASFIIYTNVAALVGKSISEEQLNQINVEIEQDVMVRAIHDVKGIDIGNSLVRYKAEMDFDGRNLTRSYLDKQDLNELLKVAQSFQTVEELENFLLKHGENIVDLMGGEIDRIEMKLRKKFPEIRHCDLEIL